MKYRILQLDIDRESVRDNRKMFMSWDILNKCCGGFDIADYKEVYSSELQTNINKKELILDKIFEKFNINHPEDFTGHSLSVSDVVILDNETYFCDSFGWKKVE